MKKLLLLALLLLALAARAQEIEIATETVTCSDLEDHDGNPYGSGSLFKLAARGSFNLSMRLDSLYRPTLWNLAGRATYGRLSNHGEAHALYPEQMLNVGVNLTHVRPLQGRWSIMAMAGVGLYSTIDELAWRDFLVNAGLIFTYTVNRTLTVGVGGTLTNTYGVPMLMPIPYLRWTYAGRFDLSVNMIGIASIKAGMRVDERLKLNLDLIDVESLSAVQRVDGKTKVCSMTDMRTALVPEFSFGQSMVSASLGVSWRRSMRITRRTLEGFFKAFNHNYRNTYNPSLYLAVSYSYRFK